MHLGLVSSFQASGYIFSGPETRSTPSWDGAQFYLILLFFLPKELTQNNSRGEIGQLWRTGKAFHCFHST